MKANSLRENGTGNHDLLSHLQAVANVARTVAPAELKDISEAIGLFHDIGKAGVSFQKFVQAANAGKIKRLPKYDGPLHHEISWAILRILSEDTSHALKYDLKKVAWGVYFHHATPYENTFAFQTAIDIIDYLNKNEPDSVHQCLGIVEQIVKTTENPLIKSLDISKFNSLFSAAKQTFGDFHTPKFGGGVEAKTFASLIALRTFQTQADWHVSGQTAEICESFSLQAPEFTSVRKVPTVLLADSDRDAEQLVLSSQIITHQLTELNELTGFGKTRVCVASYLQQTARQMIYLVPRSSLAQDRFHGLIKEFHALGENKSIEVIYGGKRQSATDVLIETGESDVVIATVDSYLLAQVNHGRSMKNVNIINCMLVVDEYHECVVEEGLFFSLAALLSFRAQYAPNDLTLLMSATPVHQIWEFAGVNPKSVFMPEVNYARQTPKIKFSITEQHVDNTIPVGHMCFVNSVRTAQQIAMQQPDLFLAHSRYTVEDKKSTVSDAIKLFSTQKSRDGEALEKGCVSTSILQSGCDISFTGMSIYEPSPFAIVQAAGRYDRAELGKGDGIIIIELSKQHLRRKSELAARPGTTPKLCDVFYDSLFGREPVVFLTRGELHQKYKELSELQPYKLHVHETFEKSKKSFQGVMLKSGGDLNGSDEETQGPGGSSGLRGDSSYYTMFDSKDELLTRMEVLTFWIDLETDMQAVEDTRKMVAGSSSFQQEVRIANEKTGGGYAYKKKLPGRTPHKNANTPAFLEGYVYDRGEEGKRGLGAIKKTDLMP